ncbi:MAG TPA: hypothetical protein DDW24_10330, partial [Blastocatellia bacterium]|nr:hypothetical protein [Blastocatellia bacterium]
FGIEIGTDSSCGKTIFEPFAGAGTSVVETDGADSFFAGELVSLLPLPPFPLPFPLGWAFKEKARTRTANNGYNFFMNAPEI